MLKYKAHADTYVDLNHPAWINCRAFIAHKSSALLQQPGRDPDYRR